MKQVLVVDDEIILREYLTELLELENYAAKGVGSIAEAWQELQKSRPDLIICDMFIGHENGLDLAEKLQKDADTKGIPLFFMSAQFSPELEQQALSAGARAFIRKPYDNNRLLQTLLEHSR